MDCVARPLMTVGPTARVYTLPRLSVTDVTCALASFQPTTTTFRFPAVCASAYVALTCVSEDCGTAAFTCTKAIAAFATAPGPATPSVSNESRRTRTDPFQRRNDIKKLRKPRRARTGPLPTRRSFFSCMHPRCHAGVLAGLAASAIGVVNIPDSAGRPYVRTRARSLRLTKARGATLSGLRQPLPSDSNAAADPPATSRRGSDDIAPRAACPRDDLRAIRRRRT